MRLEKQWINCCWEEGINNKEVNGNYENMETDNGIRQSKIWQWKG